MKELTKDQVLGIVFKTFSTCGLPYGEADEASRPFILKYWIDEFSTRSGKVKRYNFLKKGHFIKDQIDHVLSEYEIDNRYCRFYEDSKLKESVFQHPYIGLRKKINNENTYHSSKG